MTTFGLEIEMNNITIRRAATIAHSYLNSYKEMETGFMDSYLVTDQQGRNCRNWKFELDASLEGIHSQKTELITPPLTTDDLPTLKGLLEALKDAEALSSYKRGCGIHMHINSEGHTPQTLRNLVNIFAAHEDQLFKAFEVTDRIRNRYCKKTETAFLETLNKAKPTTFKQFADIWYAHNGNSGLRDDRYNSSRYHALNLHSLFDPNRYKTIELRLGQWTEETSFNWVVLESFIQLGLAMNNLALTVKTASAKRQKDWTSAYSFRCWLLRLGFIGDSTKEARKFLLQNFEGEKAWRRVA